MKVWKSNLKKLVREKFGDITQTEFARIAGVRGPSISDWWKEDRGVRQLSMGLLEPMARALGVPVSDLYYEEEIPDEEAELVA
jgi:transcriptional regulator with XRE-family HTH domain